MSTSPSDYSSRDGDCSIMHNVVVRDGEVRPMHDPVLKYTSEYRVLFVHKMTKVTNVICYDPDRGKLKYANAEGLKDINASNTGDVCAMEKLPNSVKSIGNILICDTDEGTLYIRFDGKKYVFLGNGLPELPKIAFGLHNTMHAENGHYPVDRKPTFSSLNSINVDVRCNESTLRLINDNIDEFEGVYNALMAKVMESESYASGNGGFNQPFFVRYAFRLYDGSTSRVSAPVLMVPQDMPPAVSVIGYDMARPGGGNDISFFRSEVMSYLRYCVMSSQELMVWGDIIKGIDIFISAPIRTYVQSMTAQDYIGQNGPREGITSTILSAHYSVRPERIPTTYGARDTVDGFHNYTVSAIDDDGTIDYTKFEAYKANWPAPEKSQYEHSGIFLAPLKTAAELSREMSEVSTFYHISSIPLQELSGTQSFGKFKRVVINSGVLDTLTTRETLVEDYLSNYTIKSPKSIVYNGRIIKAGDYRDITTNFTLDTMTQYIFKRDTFGTAGCYVRLAKSGADYLVPLGRCSLPLESKGNWLCYPDPDATELIFSPATPVGGVLYYYVPLKRHDLLQCAYWQPENTDTSFGYGYFKNYYSSSPPIGEDHTLVPVRSSVYMSEVNNPFVFPARYATNVGTGDVLALATATKALSEGQFGQFPIYAFTTEGIWAIEIDAEGKMIARSPITRDVCTNPDAIISIDDAIIYPSLRDVMMISGSETKSLTSSLRDRIPLLSQFPHMDSFVTIIELCGKYFENGSLPLGVKIAEYANMEGTVSGYNPQMGQILLSNPKTSYSFVLDVESGFWSTTDNEYFVGYVNDYPATLLTRIDNNVYDLSVIDYTKTKPSFLMTRPITFDDPDIYKSVRDLHVRGNFVKGSVFTALYGSQDCKVWNYISSSASEYIHLRAGSGYKYIAAAIFPGNRLKEGDSITCIDFDIQPKHTNKLR